MLRSQCLAYFEAFEVETDACRVNFSGALSLNVFYKSNLAYSYFITFL